MRWPLHFCFLDRQCRKLDCPPRVFLHLGHHTWHINLTDWSDRAHYVRGRTGEA